MLQQNECNTDYKMCIERVDFNFTAQSLMNNYLKRKISQMQSKLSIMIPWKVFCATVHWCTLHCLGHLLEQTIVLSPYDDWCHPPSVFLCPASLVWFVVEHTPALFQLVLNLLFLTSQSHPASNLSFESNPATHTHAHTQYMYVLIIYGHFLLSVLFITCQIY